MKLYSTVLGMGNAEQTIEKSRFIAYAAPVETREAAEAFIDTIRRKHHDATHNVPAMVLGDKFQVQWGSDDGEPQGTSGAPIVQMMVQEGITNTVVVVTRYFGGIKLGTGGLVRAYTQSAKMGLTAAGICDVEEMSVLTFKVDYALFNKIKNFDFGGRAVIEEPLYTDVVDFSIITSQDDAEWCKETVAGISNGKALLHEEKSRLAKVPKPVL